MEAKDTVMTDVKRTEIISRNLTLDSSMHTAGLVIGRKLLEAQAEISFKAGIKEVVKWIEDNRKPLFDIRGWLAKLKEWDV